MKTKLNFSSSLTAGLLAALSAGVINALLFFIFHASGIITDAVFIKPGQPMTVVPVLISSIMPPIIGSMVFFLFEKYTGNGFRIFSVVSVVLLVLSFANPFLGIPGVPLTYAIALDFMHVVVASSLLLFISRARKTQLN